MNGFMKNFEKNTAKHLKKNLYYWYLSGKGTHGEKLDALFESLEKIVLPPITDKLKTAISCYIEIRNKIFEAQMIVSLDMREDIRRVLS
jgi:hypothetical protein